MILSTVKTYALIGLGVLCGVLAATAWSYHTLYNSTAKALRTQNEAIEAQNNEAKTKYNALKEKSDKLQALYDQLKTDLEKQGEEGTKQIAADRQRDTAPVVVRYVSRPARCGGGSSTGGTPASTQAGAGPADTASGVLAPEAEELVKRDQDGVEALQLAFNLCKEHGR